MPFAARARRWKAAVDMKRWLRPVAQFWAASWLERFALLSTAYWKLKTQWYYQRFFGSLGRGTVIRRPMLLGGVRYVHVGSKVSIREGARIEVVDDHSGRTPCLIIGDEVNIEQGVHIVCHHRVRIGNRVSVTGGCAIVDTSHPVARRGPGGIGREVVCDDMSVEIGDGAFLGFGATVLPGVRIGEGAVIGAGAVVRTDVPDGCVAAGVPAVIVVPAPVAGIPEA